MFITGKFIFSKNAQQIKKSVSLRRQKTNGSVVQFG